MRNLVQLCLGVSSEEDLVECCVKIWRFLLLCHTYYDYYSPQKGYLWPRYCAQLYKVKCIVNLLCLGVVFCWLSECKVCCWSGCVSRAIALTTRLCTRLCTGSALLCYLGGEIGHRLLHSSVKGSVNVQGSVQAGGHISCQQLCSA